MTALALLVFALLAFACIPSAYLLGKRHGQFYVTTQAFNDGFTLGKAAAVRRIRQAIKDGETARAES